MATPINMGGNCDYTTAPGAPMSPSQLSALTPTSSTSTLPYETGTCSLAVAQVGRGKDDSTYLLDVDITDNGNNTIGGINSTDRWTSTNPLVIPPDKLQDAFTISPAQSEGPLSFTLGAQTWDSSPPRCTDYGWNDELWYNVSSHSLRIFSGTNSRLGARCRVWLSMYLR